MAEIVPVSPRGARTAWIGSMKGKMEILGDIVSSVVDETEINDS